MADGSDGFDWGFRFDGMYGTDADDTQAFGNNPGNWDYENGFDRGGGYGFAIPQLYLEAVYEDFSLIGGHFYTLLGYEVVTAPDNFFFSHAFTMYNSEAFTHTGVLAAYTGIEWIDFYGGWTLGWDTGFDQFSNGNSFLGGFSITPIDQISLTYITTVGDFGAIGGGYSHSIVIDTAVNDRLNYVFQSDLVSTNDDPRGNNDQFGINQYLIYQVSDCVAAGTRLEWWKSDGVSTYGATFGVNVSPSANLRIRPEVRHLWTPAGTLATGNQDETIFGIDAIITF